MNGVRLGYEGLLQAASYRAPRGNTHKTPLIIPEGKVALRDLPDCDECPLDTYLACKAAVRDYKRFASDDCNKALAKPQPGPSEGQPYLPGLEDMQ